MCACEGGEGGGVGGGRYWINKIHKITQHFSLSSLQHPEEKQQQIMPWWLQISFKQTSKNSSISAKKTTTKNVHIKIKHSIQVEGGMGGGEQNKQKKKFFKWKAAHTLLAYLRALSVSSKLEEAGLTQQIITVLALPPKESCNSEQHTGRVTRPVVQVELLMKNHPDDGPPWWQTTLMINHTDERPPWWEITLNDRLPWWKTTLMVDHPDGRPPSMTDHPDDRPPLMIDHPDGRPPLMTDHPDDRPPLMIDHPDDRPHWW